MWPFKKKAEEPQPLVDETSVSEAVKPSEDIIESILNETFSGVLARQWANWAALQIGEEPKYYYGYLYTPKCLWVLYEGCRVYKGGFK